MSATWLRIRAIAYVLSPALRRKWEMQAGWNMVSGAISHILFRPDCLKGDLDASRILIAKLKELS